MVSRLDSSPPHGPRPATQACSLAGLACGSSLRGPRSICAAEPPTARSDSGHLGSGHVSPLPAREEAGDTLTHAARLPIGYSDLDLGLPPLGCIFRSSHATPYSHSTLSGRPEGVAASLAQPGGLGTAPDSYTHGYQGWSQPPAERPAHNPGLYSSHYRCSRHSSREQRLAKGPGRKPGRPFTGSVLLHMASGQTASHQPPGIHRDVGYTRCLLYCLRRRRPWQAPSRLQPLDTSPLPCRGC